MTKLIPRWFACMVLASMAVVTYGTLSLKPAEEAAPLNRELYDALWIDRYPEMAHDKWKAYLFTADNVGLSIDAASAFKLTLEVFEFKADKKSITYHFPHDSRRARCNYSIEKLKKPTSHFDTQLTVENDPQNGGQTKVYFTGPEFRSAETLPPHLRQAVEAYWN